MTGPLAGAVAEQGTGDGKLKHGIKFLDEKGKTREVPENAKESCSTLALKDGKAADALAEAEAQPGPRLVREDGKETIPEILVRRATSVLEDEAPDAKAPVSTLNGGVNVEDGITLLHGEAGSSGGRHRGRRKERKRHKKDKNRKRDRSSSRSSSSSGNSSFDREMSFRVPSSTNGSGLTAFQRIALRYPGKLLQRGIVSMERFARPRGLGGGGGNILPMGIVLQYLMCIVTVNKSATISQRNQRELRTLAEALDLLAAGRIASLGDLLMQRFKALEISIVEGWNVAKHMELIPEDESMSVTEAERKLATALEVKDLRFNQLRTRARG